MKTAMQELIEYIEMNPIVFNKELLLKLKELTFKEKEQIQKAFEIGYNEGCSYMYDNGNDLNNGIEYYNQTYNQNK